MTRRMFAVTLFAILGASFARAAGPATIVMTPAGAASLPVRIEHRYRMLGKVRPLLFWISRDDVGGARIRWTGADAANGFELLIGSDPARAPRQINKWGYIAEEV